MPKQISRMRVCSGNMRNVKFRKGTFLFEFFSQVKNDLLNFSEQNKPRFMIPQMNFNLDKEVGISLFIRIQIIYFSRKKNKSAENSEETKSDKVFFRLKLLDHHRQ